MSFPLLSITTVCNAGLFLLLMATSILSADGVDLPSHSIPDISQLESPDQLKAWSDLLFNNPNDPKLWNAELARQMRRAEMFLKQDRESPLGPKVELDLANSYQSKGIALRHLKRHEEALSSLTDSIAVLAQLEMKYKCREIESVNESPICGSIVDMTRNTFIFFANVYHDLGDTRNTAKYLNLAIESPSTFEDFQRTLSRLVSLYLNRNDFSSALNIILNNISVELKRKDLKAAAALAKMASGIYRELFDTISWIPNTKDLRENDPRDFADRNGIGIGENAKYGMTDPEEDYATFLTLFIIQEGRLDSPEAKKNPRRFGYNSYDDLLRDSDLDAYIRTQLAVRNFEPAAKYLYHRYLVFNFGKALGGPLSCPYKNPKSVSFTEVRKAIETEPRAIPHWTRYVIDLLFQGAQFLDTYCLTSVE